MLNASLIAVGDVCEFISDKQTEKGPSSGRVIAANTDVVVIAHSDHAGEIFSRADLLVNYGCNKKEFTYWELA